MSLIECCRSNLSREARMELSGSPHRIRETICLDRCGTCYEEPFLVVDGELRRGDSYRDILRSLDRDCEGCGE